MQTSARNPADPHRYIRVVQKLYHRRLRREIQRFDTTRDLQRIVVFDDVADKRIFLRIDQAEALANGASLETVLQPKPTKGPEPDAEHNVPRRANPRH